MLSFMKWIRSFFVELNLKRHDNDTIETVFNCDGCYFVTWSTDNTCKIWQRDPYDVWQAQDNAKRKHLKENTAMSKS